MRARRGSQASTSRGCSCSFMARLACLPASGGSCRRPGSTPPTGLQLGQAYELDAIAAVILGGTSFVGGVGSIWGTLIGALMIAVLGNGLILLGVSDVWQYIVKGGWSSRGGARPLPTDGRRPHLTPSGNGAGSGIDRHRARSQRRDVGSIAALPAPTPRAIRFRPLAVLPDQPKVTKGRRSPTSA
jgi:hypothetical protein